MKRHALAALIASLFVLTACGQQAADQSARQPAEAAASAQKAGAQVPQGELPVIEAVLTSAPNVPPPVNRDYPAKVVVKMEVIEKVMSMADGVDYIVDLK